MENGLLSENAPLYRKIKEESPDWWLLVTSDPELYVEIRKKNIIDIYYNGGRAAQVTYINGQYKLTAHPKYVYENVTEDDCRYYKHYINNKGKNAYTAIYQDCAQCFCSKEQLESMKRRIEKQYSNDGNGEEEKKDEKFIQGSLIVSHRDKYLDSEFAYKLTNEPRSRKTIRFDLVKLENDKLVFVELKRFWDSRMRTSQGEPEIIDQMKKYIAFIKANKQQLRDYYKTLYRIKRMLGLPIPSINDIDNLEIDPMPQLLIALNHDDKKHSANAKKNRMEYINEWLEKLKIHPEYFTDQ